MEQVKQLADIDTSKYINARCPEAGADAVIIDIDKVKSSTIKTEQGIPQILKETVGAKLIFMEPITGGADPLEGLILYFMLPNGDQRVIEIDPADFENITIQFYKLDRQK